ncbi:MAG TPA: Pycsar system effector family protein [Myxococcota bacterium]|nr:Pycsar system effector family protein [Myxococcota bacterium]
MSEPTATPDLEPAGAPDADVHLEGKAKRKKGDGGTRAIETLYRVLYRNHIELTALADTKANMMVGINGLLASAALGFVTPRLADGRIAEAVPALIPLAGCALSLACAILSARPRVSSSPVTLADVRENRASLMFFGHFVRLEPDAYVAGLREMEERSDLLRSQMGRDIHALGVVLAKKYRLLRTSYSVLLATVVASAAGLVWRIAAQ